MHCRDVDGVRVDWVASACSALAGMGLQKRDVSLWLPDASERDRCGVE